MAAIGQNNGCANGNFENGDFSGWEGKYGERTPTSINVGSLTNGFHPDHHLITSPGFDPNVGGTLLSTVGEGNRAVRIGTRDGDRDATMISYNFVVNSANKDFGFRYALVMQDGKHGDPENPYFGYIIRTTSGGFLGMGDYIAGDKIVADENDPFFEVDNGYVWRDWSWQCQDLSAHIGKEVNVTFYIADCHQGGHGAYAYIDGLCSENDATVAFNIQNTVCINTPIVANGSPSTGEDSHFWSMQKANADWSTIGPEYTQWFVGQEAGPIDLRAFFESKGGTIDCNSYYRVKLVVTSDCTPWKEHTELIHVTCPENVPILEDRIYCCDDDPAIIIGTYGQGLQHEYDIEPFTPLLLSPPGGIGIRPTENTHITVTTTDDEGCSVTQEMNVWFINSFDVKIVSTKVGCCKERLTAKIVWNDDGCTPVNQLSKIDEAYILSQINFKWSNGEKGQSILVSGAHNTTYTVNASIPQACSNASASYNYAGSDLYTTSAVYEGGLIAPASFTPDGGGVNNVFEIYEFAPDAPVIGDVTDPAYGIIGYQLIVYNRYGHIIYNHLEEDCTYYQGDIRWDGTKSDGTPVQDGTYNYQLWVKTCNGQNGTWHQICDIEGAQAGYGICIDGHTCVFCWPPLGYVCDEYWVPDGQNPFLPDGNNGDCIFAVTVIR